MCERTYNHVVQEDCNDVLDDLVNQVVIRDESEVLLNKLMDIIEYRQKDSEDFIQQVIEAVINQIFDDINSRETTQLRSQLHESLMIMFITPLLLSLSVKYYKIDSMDSSVFFLSLWITSFVLVLCNLNQFGNNIKLHLNESYLPSRFFKPANHCVPHGMSSPQISLPTV